MRFLHLLCIPIFCIPGFLNAQDVTIQVHAQDGQRYISPYIYGRNGNFSDSRAPLAAEITRYRSAGLRFSRENSGNNATKYNWRKKLSSHPDWYNNVYEHDWDFEAAQIMETFPDMQVMYAFQLLGWAADNTNNNFNDWQFNSSQWWEGVNQNLAGGGVVNTAGGSNALTDGNPDLYLMDWPADSTVAILDHWFGEDGIDLPQANFRYWNMDNEPEIWSGTHDDVMEVQLAADAFMEKYFEVAKKAKEKSPDIKLCGPVMANEWQWYRYADENLDIGGQYYCWLEYFIKRCADEEKASGIPVLDVVDIHFYPFETEPADLVQLHRVFYDEAYNYPGANGVKTIHGGWESSLQNEYIFGRINSWLNEHYGAGHGIGIGLSEFGTQTDDPDINAVLYASMLGTFADQGVELFAPWYWQNGMWEVLHLYSRYTHAVRVKTISSLENTVSAYSTLTTSADSLTVILVNRDLSASHDAQVVISDFTVKNGNYPTLQLSSLPGDETFVSHTDNALFAGTVELVGQTLSLTLPPLSTTAVLITGSGHVDDLSSVKNIDKSLRLYPNPSANRIWIEPGAELSGDIRVAVFDHTGRQLDFFSWQGRTRKALEIDVRNYPEGMYFVQLKSHTVTLNGKFLVRKN
ncbi:MAG: T9SS type A sorting domain-containing protein [Bacteroidales bacterium]|nr:T9SS type A sorting domain-containing protein [Bacteroidales bacterium]